MIFRIPPYCMATRASFSNGFDHCKNSIQEAWYRVGNPQLQTGFQPGDELESKLCLLEKQRPMGQIFIKRRDRQALMQALQLMRYAELKQRIHVWRRCSPGHQAIGVYMCMYTYIYICIYIYIYTYSCSMQNGHQDA